MNYFISPQERLDLKKLIQTSECEDNTDHIRKTKHSTKIQNDIMELANFRKKNAQMYENQFDFFEMEAQTVANFLYVNYTDIFNRILRDEIDYSIMARVLYVLKGIEDEKVDQHEGSLLVGKVLKELYLDSAIRHGKNLDKKYAKEAPVESEPVVPEKIISWKEYKQTKP